jgi:hypothetical protein
MDSSFTCKRCGKAFERPNTSGRLPYYCSEFCARGRTARVVVCKICEQSFVQSHGHQRICSAECRRENGKLRSEKYYRENREKIIAKAHRLSEEQYEFLIDSQDGTCFFCQRAQASICVDHDHDCCNEKFGCPECIRGVLCQACNSRLGWYETNRELFEKYIDKLPISFLHNHAHWAVRHEKLIHQYLARRPLAGGSE